MEPKIKHHCKFNNKLFSLTPLEHHIVHDIEATALTPNFRNVNEAILRAIKTCKKDFCFIKAWRIKRLLKYYKKVIEDEYFKIFQFNKKLQVYCGRTNGKTFYTNNVWLNVQYRQLKKQHKYIKALKIKRLTKKYISILQNEKL